MHIRVYACTHTICIAVLCILILVLYAYIYYNILFNIGKHVNKRPCYIQIYNFHFTHIKKSILCYLSGYHQNSLDSVVP